MTHIGLLLVLLGAMARAVPGWYLDALIWVPDGETVLVPSTEWALRSEGFTADFYPDGRPRNYETLTVVVDGADDVQRQPIRVNEPLYYQGIKLYQVNYITEPGTATLNLGRRDGAAVQGQFIVDLQRPESEYMVGDTRIHVPAYFPDFGLDDKQQPITLSADPRNPANHPWTGSGTSFHRFEWRRP